MVDLTGGTAAKPVLLQRQTSERGPDCAAACVPVRALTGIGPRAIVFGLRLTRPRVAPEERVVGLLRDLHGARAEAVMLRRAILAVAVPSRAQIGDEGSIRRDVDPGVRRNVVVADNRAAIDGDRLRRRAAAAAEAEVLLQSADRIRKTRACLAAQLTDALLEVAGTLRDADHGARAEARDVADQVRADAGRLKPAFDRINVADAGIQLTAKIVDRALALAGRDAAERRPDAGGRDATGAPLPTGRATGARGERGDGVFDGVQDVVEVAAVGAGGAGRGDRGQRDRRGTQCDSKYEPRTSAHDRSPSLDAKSFRRSFTGLRASITRRLLYSPQDFGQTGM